MFGGYSHRLFVCQRCGDRQEGVFHMFARFCGPCGPKRMNDFGGTAAHKAVQNAIRRGELPRAKTLTCTDCGKPAHDYDHRDYAKPLEVEPVCRSCNRLRGPARIAVDFELPA